jgi:hypothetical protein
MIDESSDLLHSGLRLHPRGQSGTDAAPSAVNSLFPKGLTGRIFTADETDFTDGNNSARRNSAPCKTVRFRSDSGPILYRFQTDFRRSSDRLTKQNPCLQAAYENHLPWDTEKIGRRSDFARNHPLSVTQNEQEQNRKADRFCSVLDRFAVGSSIKKQM